MSFRVRAARRSDLRSFYNLAKLTGDREDAIRKAIERAPDHRAGAQFFLKARLR